jgi:putative oxidoreductase
VIDLHSLALAILRTFVGVALMLHGYGKTRNARGFAAKFNLPVPFAYAVTYAQVTGGALLVAGAATRIACLAVGITMAGAIWKCLSRHERFIDPEHHSWESAAFYLMAAVVIAILGPGSYAIDGWWLR